MFEIYFLQHRNFTLFDAKDAFHASTGTWHVRCHSHCVSICE